METSLRAVIEASVREHGEDLKAVARKTKLYLDTAMNSAGHYRSRGNWHVFLSLHHFVWGMSTDRYVLCRATLPTGSVLHVLVFYA